MNKEKHFSIEEEGQTLIALGKLLRKKRDPQKQKQVEQILAQDTGNQEKINLILSIDGVSHEQFFGDTETRKETAQQTLGRRFYGTDSDRLNKSRAGKKREKIKQKLTPSPFFRYFFRELPKIRAFTLRSGVLNTGYFPPSIRARRDIRSFFITYYQPLVSECLNLLNQLMGNSWMFLLKKDYNLLAVFQNFCRLIVTENFTRFQYKDRSCIDSLSSIENHFLSLHYNMDFISRILSSIDTLLTNNRRRIPNLETLPSLIRKILHSGTMGQTFSNIITGLNMMKYRRYFVLEDLIRNDLGEIIDTDIFDCPEKTQREIDRHINDIIERLKLLNQEKYEIQRLQDFIHIDKEGKIVLARLQLFYDNTYMEKDRDFETDSKEIIPFVSRFIRLFVKTFDSLLNEKVYLSKLGPVRIFKENTFHEKFTRLILLGEKLESIIFRLPSFTRHRYLQIKHKSKGAIPVEAETIMIVDECIEILIDLSKQIDIVLRSYYPGEPMEPAGFSPADIRSFEKTLSLFPFENRYMDIEHPFYEKKLVEILSDLVSVCYAFAANLQDISLLHMLGKERSVEDEIQTRLEKLERIAEAHIYADVKSLFE